MSEAMQIAVISAVVTGLFGLIGKRMELARPSAPTNATLREGATSQKNIVNNELNIAQSYAGSVNFGTTIRHVGVLQLCLNLIGLLIGAALGLAGASLTSILVATLIIGTIVLAVGFWISGSLVYRSIRWTHLIYVAIGTLIVTLILNSLVFQQPITSAGLILGLLQTFGAMIIAGVLLNTIKHD